MSDDEDFVPDAEPSAAPSAGAKRKRAQRFDNVYEESEEDDDETRHKKKPQRRGPADARRTERGGYAHTADSREKIGKANKGNTPWNKGKNRSNTDREKIGAGVRARNHKILMNNLNGIGMSEEEYRSTRLDIKYIRERVRKARIANKTRIEKERLAKEKIKEYWKNEAKRKEEEEEPVEEAIVIEEIIEETDDEEEEEEEEEQQQAASKMPAGQEQGPATSQPATTTLEPDTVKKQDPIPTQQNQTDNLASTAAGGSVGTMRVGETGAITLEMSSEHMPSVFRRDIAWDQHFYDDVNTNNLQDAQFGLEHTVDPPRDKEKPPNNGKPKKDEDGKKEQANLEPYKDHCPVGGPGGLICCSTCTANYSMFLIETERNLEHQKMEQLEWETSTVVHFLKQTKERLQASIPAARKLPPPVVPVQKKPPPSETNKDGDPDSKDVMEDDGDPDSKAKSQEDSLSRDQEEGDSPSKDQNGDGSPFKDQEGDNSPSKDQEGDNSPSQAPKEDDSMSNANENDGQTEPDKESTHHQKQL